MSAFEYLLLLAAVILALAITDLAVSAHRLLTAGRRVRWSVLPVLAALLAFSRVVAQWWSWRSAEALARGITFGMFAAVLASATLLFLMAACALPDDVSDESLDLRAYWTANYRRFWLLFAAQWVTWTAASSWAQIAVAGAKFTWVSPAYLVLPASLALAFLPKKIFQGAGLLAFIALYVCAYGPQTLAG